MRFLSWPFRPFFENEMTEAAGRFMEGSSEACIYTILFKAALTINAELSVLQLKEVVGYLSERTISIANEQRLTEEALKPMLMVVARMMDIEELPMGCLETMLSQFGSLGLLKPHNPYPNRIALIEKQLKNSSLPKDTRALLEERLETLKEQAIQFEQYPLDPEEMLRERVRIVLNLKRKANEANDSDRMDEGKEDELALPEKRRKLNRS